MRYAARAIHNNRYGWLPPVDLFYCEGLKFITCFDAPSAVSKAHWEGIIERLEPAFDLEFQILPYPTARVIHRLEGDQPNYRVNLKGNKYG